MRLNKLSHLAPFRFRGGIGMAGQSNATEDSSKAWGQIDGTTANVIGKRVFFSHPQLGKCLAFVVGVTGQRSPEVRNADLNVVSGGQNLDIVLVFPNDGSAPYTVQAALSDDRGFKGTYALANDGDVSDNPNTPRHTEQPAVEQPVEEPAPNTNQQGSAGQFAEADFNRDGIVSPKEQKQYDRGRRE
jgi:hypothetical protein